MKRTILLLIIANFSLQVFSQDQSIPRLDKSTRNIVLNSICEHLNKYYVFPDKANLMTSYLKQQNEKSKYDLYTNPKEFANKLVNDIRSVYNDIHLRIEFNPKLEADIKRFHSLKKRAEQISEADVARDEKINFYFKKLEILPSNIGYIKINGFASPGLSTRKTIYSAMQFVAHTDALIIDLRDNFGGNDETAREIGGYFFKTKTYIGKGFNRIENKWTDRYLENRKEITNGLVLNMPVYILTSRRTFSGAEWFAYTFQTVKNSVIIGDTTRGGAHLTRSFSLGNGFVGFIPYAREENTITHRDWEGTGVIPNVVTADDVSLSSAQNIILTKKLSETINETERRKINYIINYNQAKSTTVILDSLYALKLCGQFSEFQVTFQGGQVMFRDKNQRNIKLIKMDAVSSTLFQVGDDYQVEFIFQNDSCNLIKMYWDDGWEESIKRN